MSSDQYTAEAICNQALQAAGVPYVIGSLQEGSEAANACLRLYSECVRQLLRGAHWDHFRREAVLQMVADASGQTPNVGNMVPSGFLYSYSYPVDCAKIRFIPANYWQVTPPTPASNITPSDASAPTMQGLSTQPWVGQRLTPSRFLITNEQNFIPEGAGNQTPGVSPIGQVLILSNVQNARAVYTLQAMWPNLWDSLFRSAVVDYLASEIAFPLNRDKRLGLQIQDRLVMRAQAKLSEARRTNGNESWANADIQVDWMRARLSGGFRGYWGSGLGGDIGGPGFLFGAYESVAFAGNTAAF